jgi:tRNA dimethylallyltransferase
MIGLTASRVFINRRIAERVKERIRNGFEEELLGFVQGGIDWKYQSMQSLGYRQYEKYFKGLISRRDFVDKWTVEEQKYAKRQMTWFKKDRRIKWFEISQKNWEYKVEKFVQSWYYE